jgi:glycyl-tRNA synthetase beta chain
MPPEPRTLLVELGCEEIPAGFLARGLVELAALAEQRLGAARLGHAGLRTVGTPRRLTLIVTDLADRQLDVSERVVGPPARAAFGPDGKPTRAAIGFAEKNGVSLDALEIAEVEGQKKGSKPGEYVVATRRETGRPTAEVLPALIEELFAALPWPKSMRWPQAEIAFVRPVHWLVALYGGEVVRCRFAGVAAGRQSRGHRFLAPGPIDLDGAPHSYERALREAHVVVDPAKRRTMIEAELRRIEQETGATVRRDDDLLAEVTNLVEYPVAVAGAFDRAFLEVPEEVVVSAMRAHQRYFAMDEGGQLAARFVTIAGTVVKDVAQVRHGNERVLAARLADAAFFFREDQKHGLEHFRARLDGVVFQKKLGTIGQKVERLRALSRALGERLTVDPATCDRAAALAKVDLATAMVGEFPELQGAMGRRYAARKGEPEAVSLAVYEHYLPRGARDSTPSQPTGAVVGLADRLDTLVGGFAAGLQPTGSADAFGLRRAALGVLRILLDRSWRLSLVELVGLAGDALAPQIAVDAATRAQVLEFLTTRLRGYLVEAGELPADCVEAALAAGADDVVDARERVLALSRLRGRPDFEPLAAAFKRVANILKGEGDGRAPDPAAFVVDEERELWAAFEKIEARVRDSLAGRDYGAALAVMAELKAPVDRFFDKVLVMDPDDRIKQNRLALLGTIHAGFHRIADFRQLAV